LSGGAVSGVAQHQMTRAAPNDKSVLGLHWWGITFFAKLLNEFVFLGRALSY